MLDVKYLCGANISVTESEIFLTINGRRAVVLLSVRNCETVKYVSFFKLNIQLHETRRLKKLSV